MRNIDKAFCDIRYRRRSMQVRKCEKCGHSIDFRSGLKYIICSWCGARIYKNDRTKFKVELEERLKKND